MLKIRNKKIETKSKLNLSYILRKQLLICLIQF